MKAEHVLKAADVQAMAARCRPGMTPDEMARVSFQDGAQGRRSQERERMRAVFAAGIRVALALRYVNPNRCEECKGLGHVDSEEGDCPTCDQAIPVTCPKCKGTGVRN